MTVDDTESIRSNDVRTKVKTIPPPPPFLMLDTLEDNVTDTSSSSVSSLSSSKSISCHYQKFSTFDFPLLSSETTTYKSTHSTVMCVSNSGSWTKNDGHDGRRLHHSKHDPTKRIERQQKQRQQLYESIYSNNDGRNQPQLNRQHRSKNNKSNRERSRHSIAQEKRKGKELASSLRQSKIDRELHNEHRTFMTNLQRERKDKFKLENGAATRIQSFLRGVHVRQSLFPERYYGDENGTEGMFCGYFRKTHPPSEDEIWQVMLDAAVKLGIKPEKEMLFGFSVPPQFQHYMAQSDDELQ